MAVVEVLVIRVDLFMMGTSPYSKVVITTFFILCKLFEFAFVTSTEDQL